MRIFRGLNNIELDGGNTCLTLGVFDGVHIGHQQLLQKVVSTAREHNLISLAVTFDPHPEAILTKRGGPPLLTTLDEKLALMNHTGIKAVAVIPFNRTMANMTDLAFIDKVLLSKLRGRYIIAGPETTFGKGGTGNAELLEKVGNEEGFEVDVVQEVTIGSKPVSSTAIRHAVAEGDLSSAMNMLGRPYYLAGKVMPGDGRGRDLGFPTANFPPPSGKVIPPDGVYACIASIDESIEALTIEAMKQPDGSVAMVYIGKRPTFGGVDRIIETHICEELQELYDQQLGLHFIKRLRGDKAFNGPDELVEQMVEDAHQAFEVIGSFYQS